MKTTLLTILVKTIFAFNLYSQYLPLTSTYYTESNNSGVGKENMSFSLSNGYIKINDPYYNTEKRYGPLKLSQTGFTDEGFYYEFYKPDLESGNPNLINARTFYMYKIAYETKGGAVIYILEGESISNTLYHKFYYTQFGYNKIYGKSNNNGAGTALKETNFDVMDVIMSSHSISQIMSKINFAFEQTNKTLSNDGNTVTITYENNSLINALVAYTKEGNVKHIVFLMPKENSNEIAKALINRFGLSKVNGEDLIIRGNITYDYRSDGEVGMIVIK
jgi:hypothetical protein